MAAQILQTIVEHTKTRVAEDKKKVSMEEMKEMAESLPRGEFIFQEILEENAREGKVSIISEVKKASPSKGIISPEFPYLEIAHAYEQIGCHCLSVLTEPQWFLGSDEIFREIRGRSSLPMLRKDFTIDPYQIYQAKVMGADAILLICAVLEEETMVSMLEICNTLGISALVETHDEKELAMAQRIGAKIIGVNNRNLHDFSVDLSNASTLRQKLEENSENTVIFVAESGIATPQDGISLAKSGANALLIGEALMKASDRKAFVEELFQGANATG